MTKGEQLAKIVRQIEEAHELRIAQRAFHICWNLARLNPERKTIQWVKSRGIYYTRYRTDRYTHTFCHSGMTIKGTVNHNRHYNLWPGVWIEDPKTYNAEIYVNGKLVFSDEQDKLAETAAKLDVPTGRLNGIAVYIPGDWLDDLATHEGTIRTNYQRSIAKERAAKAIKDRKIAKEKQTQFNSGIARFGL